MRVLMKVVSFCSEELKLLDPINGVLLDKGGGAGNGAFYKQKTALDPLLFIISPHRRKLLSLVHDVYVPITECVV